MGLMIPGIGSVTEHGDGLVTDLRYVRMLGKQFRLRIDGYDPQDSTNLVACVEAFCALEPLDLRSATRDVFAYYQDIASTCGEEPGFPQINTPGTVWDFVTLTQEPVFGREDDSGPWYVVLENECSWEPEHGLMIVFREGRIVTKVGEFDGHLTNRHAYGDDSIPDGAVYWKL